MSDGMNSFSTSSLLFNLYTNMVCINPFNQISVLDRINKMLLLQLMQQIILFLIQCFNFLEKQKLSEKMKHRICCLILYTHLNI